MSKDAFSLLHLSDLLHLAGLTPGEAQSWTGYTGQHWRRLTTGKAPVSKLLREKIRKLTAENLALRAAQAARSRPV